MKNNVVRLCLLASVMLVSACAGFLKPPLLGAPSDTGLAIVDAQVEITGLLGGTSLAVARTATIQRVGDNVSFTLSAADQGVVVFSNLKPGRYQLAEVTAMVGDNERTIPIPADQRQPFTFDLDAGEVEYLGKVNAHGSFKLTSFGNSEYTLIESAVYERRALNRVIELYPDSAWTPLLRQRLSRL